MKNLVKLDKFINMYLKKTIITDNHKIDHKIQTHIVFVKDNYKM